MKTTAVNIEGAFTIDQQVANWFIGIGTILALLGAIATLNLFLATVAATYFLGSLMFAGGILQLIHAAGLRWKGWAFFWGFSGVLYLLAAVSVLYDPLFAARFLTLFLAIMLATAGIIRVVIAFGERGRGWGWMLGSGLASLCAAALVALGWPNNSVWVLGLVLAVDLLFQGAMLMLTGFALRSAGH